MICNVKQNNFTKLDCSNRLNMLGNPAGIVYCYVAGITLQIFIQLGLYKEMMHIDMLLHSKFGLFCQKFYKDKINTIDSKIDNRLNYDCEKLRLCGMR